MRRLWQRIDPSCVPVSARDILNADRSTHENEDILGIFLPAFNHFLVCLLRSLEIHGEERPRAVTGAGLFRFLIWCRPGLAATYFI